MDTRKTWTPKVGFLHQKSKITWRRSTPFVFYWKGPSLLRGHYITNPSNALLRGNPSNSPYMCSVWYPFLSLYGWCEKSRTPFALLRLCSDYLVGKAKRSSRNPGCSSLSTAQLELRRIQHRCTWKPMNHNFWASTPQKRRNENGTTKTGSFNTCCSGWF